MKKAFVKLASCLCLVASVTSATAGEKIDYTKMSSQQLAEHLIFNSDGFKLDKPVQEGGTARERLVQDELQKSCSVVGNATIPADTSVKVMTMARNSYRYPEGGIKLGDWKIGRELAWSGYGFRAGHKNDDHSTTKYGPGGNCYNCHQLATDRTGGSIGPALTGYGKARGTSDAILKYTYEVIYNPHAYFPCTHMPRIGAKKLLTEEQISHVMAYLFDPESPVNK
ncbi:MAG: sulfur oxidation c-type cytochrome SoxX [Gammaproteobacteria bacterium]|nr:sulfur oxidation c-type cytochrome SoxX [Gammaproteobacteria bacterium]